MVVDAVGVAVLVGGAVAGDVPAAHGQELVQGGLDVGGGPSGDGEAVQAGHESMGGDGSEPVDPAAEVTGKPHHPPIRPV